jgi:hypothetical protein
MQFESLHVEVVHINKQDGDYATSEIGQTNSCLVILL